MTRYWVLVSNLVYALLCASMFVLFNKAWNEENFSFLIVMSLPIWLFLALLKILESSYKVQLLRRCLVPITVACVLGPLGILAALIIGPHAGYAIPLPFLIAQVILIVLVIFRTKTIKNKSPKLDSGNQ